MVNQNMLNLSVGFTLNNPVIPVAYHIAPRNLYAIRVTKENEKVILTKL